MNNFNSNIFYISIIISSSLLAFLSQTITSNSKGERQSYSTYLLMLSFFVITLPVALRYYTGADYNSYVDIYRTIENQGIHAPSVSNLEIGYVFLNYICCKIFNDYQSVFIVMALLTNYFFFKGIVYESKKINLGLAVFTYGFTLYFWGFIIIRNMLGIALCFYSLRFIFEKKMVKYFIVVTIAISFHYALIIFYIIGILFMEKWKRLRMPITIISALLIPILPNIIVSFGYVLSSVFTRFSYYNYYLENVNFNYGLYFIISLMPLIPFSIFYKRLIKINPNINLYFSLYVLSIVFLVFTYSMPLMTRFVYALWPSQFILFSSFLHVFDNIKNRGYRVLIKSIGLTTIFIYGMIWIFYFINNDYYYMIPYKSIFQR